MTEAPPMAWSATAKAAVRKAERPDRRACSGGVTSQRQPMAAPKEEQIRKSTNQTSGSQLGELYARLGANASNAEMRLGKYKKASQIMNICHKLFIFQK
jgi:hypothetical protein